MPTVTVTIDAMDWLTWVQTKYEKYVDYFVDYNENRPEPWYCTMKILSYDEFCNANTNRLQRRYRKYLYNLYSTSDES